MTIQEKFAEVQNHPLVVLLLKYYAKKSDKPIPPVWQAFIRESTESTSLDLLYTQISKWGLHPDNIPPDLRGQELLNHLLGIKFQPMLARIQAEMTMKKLGFIPALEAIFRALRYIPHGVASNNLESKFNIRTNLMYSYVERGTITYQITRMVPAQVLIPAAFIRAFFGPEHDDNRIWAYFINGLSTRFKSPSETQTMNSSVDWLTQLLYKPDGSHIRVPTMTRVMSSSAFPLTVNLCCSQSEFASVLTLSNPVPNTVDPTSARFKIPEDQRQRPLEFSMEFPVLTLKDSYEAITLGTPMTEDPVPIFGAPLGMFHTDPGNPDVQAMHRTFIAALRNAYDRVTESDAFQAQRKAAIELAAGV